MAAVFGMDPWNPYEVIMSIGIYRAANVLCNEPVMLAYWSQSSRLDALKPAGAKYYSFLVMNWLGRNLSNLNLFGRYFFSNANRYSYQEDVVVPKDFPCAPQTPYVGLRMVIF